MIKCGFYIENDGLKSVDCTDLRKGNPGIGGVEYATLLVAEWLSLTKDDISLTLYVRSSQNLPPSIHVNVCSDVMEALVKSVNNGDEIFVLRFEPLYLQRHLLDNSFLHKLKIVLWAHNFYSRRYLQSPNQKIPDRKTKCVIKTHINIKQNVIFGAKLKPV
ncbi:hypothetical protein [uncultured Bacteroides sp.]|uniref:hypothetical protein n=1 Tax=uncultured Bacteroides sp. TaxID=162156 RepID=UPI0025991328|nr:hypothetical protein [uncultured Bacteroides sp.]